MSYILFHWALLFLTTQMRRQEEKQVRIRFPRDSEPARLRPHERKTCPAPDNRRKISDMRIKLILISLVVFSTALLAERTRLRPGRNAYTPQQDVELGREVAKEAEQQLVLVNNSSANMYIGRLGQSLASKAPNENKFPFYFKIVDDQS